MGLKVVFWVVWASAICCCGQSGAVGGRISGVVVVVAKISMPLLSIPKKMSRLSKAFCWRLGMTLLPMGALPGGTILRNVGVAGSPVIDKTDELSQVLRTVIFEAESPPATKANAPVEENAMALAGAVRGKVCRACRGE